MAFVYLIIFIIWIWAEIAMFVALGGAVGVLLTLIGIFVTGMIGISLLRSQGRRITGALQAQLARGEAPVASLADGVSVLVGAVLMLIPGYLTDAAGLVMFLPGLRTIIGALLLKRMTARGGFTMGARMPFGGGMPFGGPSGSHRVPPPHDNVDDIIEGDFEERPTHGTPLDKKD
ncbi:MAG: FxsA family protein [Candidatus Puniceispirillaceae bacterium]